MFAQSLSPSIRTSGAARARDYVVSIPEGFFARGFDYSAGTVQSVLAEVAKGINPRTVLTTPQQDAVREQLDHVFNRFFKVREQIGDVNAAFDRDMRTLEIATLINNIAPCSWWRVPIVRADKMANVFERFQLEPLISYDEDPSRFSSAILGDIGIVLPASAAATRDQEAFLRRRLKAIITKLFEEVEEIGIESAHMRRIERTKLIVGYCASCTGR